MRKHLVFQHILTYIKIFLSRFIPEKTITHNNMIYVIWAIDKMWKVPLGYYWVWDVYMA